MMLTRIVWLGGLTLGMAIAGCAASGDGGARDGGNGRGDGGRAPDAGPVDDGGNGEPDASRDGASGADGGSTGGTTVPCDPLVLAEYEGGHVNRVDLVWTGEEFGVVWSARTEARVAELVFVRLDASGREVSDRVVLNEHTGGGAGMLPSIAWSGSAFGVAWSNGLSAPEQVRFAVVGPDGDVRAGPVTVAEVEGHADVVWTGSRFVVAWKDPGPSRSTMDGDEDIYAAGVTPSGSVGATHRLSETGELGNPNLAASPSGAIGAAWTYENSSGAGLRFARLDEEGRPMGATRTHGGEPGRADPFSSLATDGSGFAASWGHEAMRFQFLDASGAADGAAMTLHAEPGVYEMSVIWTGESYGVASLERGESALEFHRIEPGAASPTDSVSAELEGLPWFPALVWTGNQFVAAWSRRDESADSAAVAIKSLDCTPVGDLI